MLVSDPIYCGGIQVASIETRRELRGGREVWRCVGKLVDGQPFDCLSVDLYGPMFTGDVQQVVTMAEAI